MAATPGLDIMPAPTMDTLATSLRQEMPLPPRRLILSSMSFTAVSASSRDTVKEISLLFSRPMDCRITSTLIFSFASRLKSLNAMPGSSFRPITEILAVFLSSATPLINILSTLVSSLTIVPS